jgi:hypothetical protein
MKTTELDELTHPTQATIIDRQFNGRLIHLKALDKQKKKHVMKSMEKKRTLSASSQTQERE